MARPGGLAVVDISDRRLLEPWIAERPREEQDTLAGVHRVAAAALLLVATGMFMTPPAVAALVLAGLLR